jgi:hypothetical protein
MHIRCSECGYLNSRFARTCILCRNPFGPEQRRRDQVDHDQAQVERHDGKPAALRLPLLVAVLCGLAVLAVFGSERYHRYNQEPGQSQAGFNRHSQQASEEYIKARTFGSPKPSHELLQLQNREH